MLKLKHISEIKVRFTNEKEILRTQLPLTYCVQFYLLFYYIRLIVDPMVFAPFLLADTLSILIS